MPVHDEESLPLWIYTRGTPYDPDAVHREFEWINHVLMYQGMHEVGRSADIGEWPWTDEGESWVGWQEAINAVSDKRAAGICVPDIITLGRVINALPRVMTVEDLGGVVWTASPLLRLTVRDLQTAAARRPT